MAKLSLDTLPSNPVYYPTKAALKVLNTREWVVAYSGGKDSTSVLLWIEWLRRTGLVKPEVTPRLVMSDTTVEFPFLHEVSEAVMAALRGCGWKTKVVKPPVSQRLYCQIFGKGLVPPLLGTKKIRWCTWHTKAVPMRKFAKRMGHLVTVTGVRLGESVRRDKLLKDLGLEKKLPTGCAAGGECGIPAPTDLPEDGGVSKDNMLAPIVNWRTCQVVDWLTGNAGGTAATVLADLLPLTARLADVYEFGDGRGRARASLGLSANGPKPKTLRFGCVGCVAIVRDRTTARQLEKRPELRHVDQIYRLWEIARRYESRLHRPLREGDRGGTRVGGKVIKLGPVRMAVRKDLFSRFMAIRGKLKMTPVGPAEEAYIRGCWENNVYPRGWSEADE